MRGIVLAGGTGSRLFPITTSISKQLLPIYDKPLVYYPIATLMLAGIREIALITRPSDQSLFKQLLGDGSDFGIQLTYLVQDEPRGIAEAFLIGADFIENESCALILGDNIFYGIGLGKQLSETQNVQGAQIFAYQVADASPYGIVEFDSDKNPISLIEKPEYGKYKYAVPGLYFYNSDVVKKARELKPSARGELEITDLNRLYLDENRLSVKLLPRGTAWFDTGSFQELQEASTFVQIIENRQGLKIGCLEEIGWRQSWLTSSQLQQRATKLNSSPYGSYLNRLLETQN